MSRSRRDGFTLLELLVVIAIVAIFAGLILSGTCVLREGPGRSVCRNNLRQLMLALQNAESTRVAWYSSSGEFPAGCFGRPDLAPEERLSWLAEILPYLEQEPLFRQFDPRQGFDRNLVPAQTHIGIFLCRPRDARPPVQGNATHYVAMSGVGLDTANRPADSPGNGFMGYDRATTIQQIKDGTSNTIALMETRSALGPWARGGPATLRGFDPTDLPPLGESRPFGSNHTYGALNLAFADGSVRSLPASTDPKIIAAMITIDGGEAVNLD